MQLQSLHRRDDRTTLHDDLCRWLHERERPSWVGMDVAIVHTDPRHPIRLELHADVAVAIDASPHARARWLVDREHRNVDVVFLLAGENRLAALTTAARHVERGVSEAFVFDAHAGAAWGFRRSEARVDAIPITSNGALRSRLLCADVVARGGRLRLSAVATQELHEVLDRIDRALTRIAERRAS